MPQLRIHFTDRDFARTRLRLKPDLMWEIVSSAQVLQHKDGDLSFGAWRRSVRELAARDPELRTALHTVVTVAPHAAYFPDLLTPPEELCGIDQCVDAVLSTEPDRLRAEIDLIRPASGPESSWLDDLARGRSPALQQLREALRVYFRSVIAPHLPTIEEGLCSDVAPWIQRYLHDGPEGLLAALGPGTRWDPPVLFVDYPVDRDLHLDGRGLVLIPCYFVLYHPVALADPQLPPTLAFPIRTESRLLAAGRAGGDHLAALLGSTRASILRSVVGGSTTTRLAKLVGVAPATVSHHTGVLREAGLIATEREENFARHLITPLGLRVLAAGR
ncbi:ArsR/SmtB family transcription factor [Lentzea californiensis]|uniref:ArsR/SmtB family transcription factor n=1 Tax=Lentzea californiensis TaxID=438851 RepID=UPI002166066D|nr:winged helix-turn-helix domain-containing protein [Lentzea californiensis]MCR3754156.1 Helix-turn-helix domain-containing protein [Lentzea californiensis]